MPEKSKNENSYSGKKKYYFRSNWKPFQDAYIMIGHVFITAKPPRRGLMKYTTPRANMNRIEI